MPVLDENTLEEELDSLVEEGYIWATCPSCGLFLDNTEITECSICKTKFLKEQIIYQKLNKKDAC
jgi:hypothetical protein